MYFFTSYKQAFDTGQKLSSRFQIKDIANEKHHCTIIYYSKCLKPSCNGDYLGETSHMAIEGTAEHTGKDKQLHLLKHALTQNYQHVDLK